MQKARHYSCVFWQSLSVFYIVSKYGVFISKVNGPSMFPTFTGSGDIVLVDALTHRFQDVKVGDVVICTRPVNPSENIVKRVAATPGSEVTVYPGKDNPDVRTVVVPPGHVWLQGDNLTHSMDSRDYGPVPLALIKGKVFMQVWPRLKAI